MYLRFQKNVTFFQILSSFYNICFSFATFLLILKCHILMSHFFSNILPHFVTLYNILFIFKMQHFNVTFLSNIFQHLHLATLYIYEM
jgi:hypothetical protein